MLETLVAKLQYKSKTCSETLYVIENQPTSLLGRDTCLQLNLIKLMVDEVAVHKDFPQLFHGLGKLKMQHHINLRDDTRPLCLYAPRKVPHPLLPRVEEELQRMEQQGVISKVTQPTDWCSGMVVVPKANGRVRICVDLTHLNKVVKREIHPMSSVDESLAKLGKASVFSKLDANSGFWQLPLDEESKLTTFITPQGRFAFNRIPFGICYLLKADVNWQWSPVQAEAFERVKQALTSPTALARYEPQRSTIIAADA